ncbi:phage tail protein [Candidatus Colwellia aromaticivorans]|uniref:phage tail protein n=1 Tax=Candidatus Colwellia aromaticivorans TaxID=2267621 RepID=UPI000DF3B301|nr:phage tail protein [Candidatus Colwellia aromaticivorans]
MANYVPPVGFHFRVEVLGLSPNDSDIRFSDVSGLSTELSTEEVAEGGENRFLQKYPVQTKYTDLVLKRGLLKSSKVTEWIEECIQQLNITPKNIDIMLLDEDHTPLMAWHLVNAYPVKWTVSDFSARNNAIVVETLQLYYQYFKVDRG